MYVDPDGRLVWFIAGPLIGALISAASYTIQIAMSPGGFDNWNWGDFGKGVATGAVSGLVGGWAANAVKGAFAVGAGGFGFGAATGAAAGSAGGFTGGTLGSLLNGDNLGDGFLNGFKTGLIGALSGGVIGGGISGISNLNQGKPFWMSYSRPEITSAVASSIEKPSPAVIGKTGENALRADLMDRGHKIVGEHVKYTVEGGKTGSVDFVTEYEKKIFMYEAKTSTIPGKVAPLTPNQATNYPLINDGAGVQFHGNKLTSPINGAIQTKMEVNAMYWNPYEGSPKIFKSYYPTIKK